ncbi:hypothetical protein FPRO06_03537 [Fusarium proliferatum]|uniref:Uncharacterized protein n=2 Tax=Gibberella intermedia TaxID=948311 RepID=A0A1L7V9E9_FUSPR|nr:uncharacterized protein FPRO_02329 [Fusarium proliferatum ET1]KAG4252872.1 hypothetical protein FPRO03_08321 [Fusarium proliferatum]KLO84793.1 Uncharacterized protein LW93_5075 [Fusarium fujikuroi]KAG4277834.1 hypothetical protein FPRO04_07077 [Fusarium proliferatum]KAG4288715.1 hypothetical protein FPRO06_03537 [Fusarium proliferatum]RBA17390.1 hypothetical protein FPRO05_02114 [Fusarium proliferatum]
MQFFKLASFIAITFGVAQVIGSPAVIKLNDLEERQSPVTPPNSPKIMEFEEEE